MNSNDIKDVMNAQEVDIRIKLARDTKANWVKNNPVLLNGEVAVVFDLADNESTKLKIGDGSSKFNDLPYILTGTETDTGILDIIPIPVPTVKNQLTYNGSQQQPEWNNFDSTRMSISGTTSATDADDYIVAFTPNSGYAWPDNTTNPKNVTWSIQKNAATLELSKNSVTIIGTNKTDTVDITSNVERNYTATSDNSNSIVLLDNKVITITSKALGSSIVTVSHNDANFTDISKTINVYVKSLNDLDASDVKNLVTAGTAQSLLAVGDSISTPLNGTCLSFTADNLQIRSQILGFDHNKDLETSGKVSIHFILGKISDKDVALVDSKYESYPEPSEGFIMNPKDDSRFPQGTDEYLCGTTKGGWKDSYMRNIIMSSLINLFPIDIKNSITSVTKYTDNVGDSTNSASSVAATVDNLFLLSEFELFGSRSKANQYEQNKQKQYQYYRNGNDKVRYRYDKLVAQYSWLRSPYYSSNYRFCSVTSIGGNASCQAAYSCGVSPAFIISEAA